MSIKKTSDDLLNSISEFTAHLNQLDVDALNEQERFVLTTTLKGAIESISNITDIGDELDKMEKLLFYIEKEQLNSKLRSAYENKLKQQNTNKAAHRNKPKLSNDKGK